MGFWRASGEDFVNRRRSPSRDHLLLVTARVDNAKQEKMRRAGALTVVLLGLGATVWAGAMGSSALAAWLFQQNGRFAIEHLEFHSTGRLTPAHIQLYSGVVPGQNLFAVNLAAIRAKLEQVPLIAHAEVRRLLPGTLVINTQERVALARIAQPGLPVLPVDREGHLMSPPASPTLPMVVGIAERGLSPGGVLRQAAARDALALLDVHDNAHLAMAVPILSVDVSDPTQILVTLRNGGRAQLGREHVERRLNRLAEMIRYGEERDEDLVTADLTGDRNEPATFKPREGTAPPVEAAPNNNRNTGARARSGHG
jgi:cell division protein FtsQ